VRTAEEKIFNNRGEWKIDDAFKKII
jgi:hypothetical protein